MGRSRSKTEKAVAKRKDKRFVSTASTSEMRSYQTFASKYPPLPHEEFLERSRVFIKGRDAKVELLESSIIDDALGGDWSPENVAARKDEVVAKFGAELERLTPQTVSAKNVPDAAPMPRDEWLKLSSDCKGLAGRYEEFVESRRYTKADRRRMQREMQDGQEALQDMVNHNLQFAMSRVGRYKRMNNRAKKIGFAEMLSVANVGLVLAARQFDPDQNKRFTTYATYHIDGQLLDFLSVEDGNIGIKGVTGHEQKQIIEIEQLTAAYLERYHTQPTDVEIGSLEGVPASTIATRRNTVQVSTQSIYAPGQGEDEREVFIPDLLDNDGSEITSAIEQSDRESALRSVHGILNVLDAESRTAIEMMTGMEPDKYGGPKDVTKIAAELGISVKETNKLIKQALARLRRECEALDIDVEDIMER